MEVCIIPNFLRHAREAWPDQAWASARQRMRSDDDSFDCCATHHDARYDHAVN